MSLLNSIAMMRSKKTAAIPQGGAMVQDWLQDAIHNKLVRHDRDLSVLVRMAQRLFSFTELNALLSRPQPGEHRHQLAALAEALDVRFEFSGLDNLKSVGDRPVILFGNHPTGGGNVLGMSMLLAEHFSDYRILGNRHMKFVPSSSDKMIAVDPFRSGNAMNIDALLDLRREFGTNYQALGIFPAGVSSQLNVLSATISDRRWSDAFVRMARHHDALLVPIWFSGRNRLRYYLAARIRTELGFLALPAEFLRLRGQSIAVKVGTPIAPDFVRHIHTRHAQVNFLRAAVYELGYEHAIAQTPMNKSAHRAFGVKRTIQRPAAREPILIGNNLEARFVDSVASAAFAKNTVGNSPELDRATFHVLLKPRESSIPWACFQVLDWRQFTDEEISRLSPIRRAFRLPHEISKTNRHWLEIVSYGFGKEFGGFPLMRHVRTALARFMAASDEQREIVGLLTPRETNLALASIQMALLQKSFGDDVLARARARAGMLGAMQHHDWRPLRDVLPLERIPRTARTQFVDPVFGTLARIGVRFGAMGLTADPRPRPCILSRLSIDALTRNVRARQTRLG